MAGLAEVIDTEKSSSPSAIPSAMVAIMAVIVPPAEEVPDVNVTVNGVGSVKSRVAAKYKTLYCKSGLIIIESGDSICRDRAHFTQTSVHKE